MTQKALIQDADEIVRCNLASKIVIVCLLHLHNSNFVITSAKKVVHCFIKCKQSFLFLDKTIPKIKKNNVDLRTSFIA